ncbi:MAG: hypothetical protein DI555_20670 [Novosphingobium pentaromativorans]|uniref:Threonine transporter n=2 Tax=Novosphingobium TaxID=165696 RepID=A0A2W5Q3H2_9SPHN|nr:MAG: hypothetical protein DI555_20670 [Novosphingobium pentaromativorans]
MECGLRALYLLDAARDGRNELQRLITYDYLLVHSGDIEGGPPSLHPAVPYRGGEFLVKREALRDGLDLMFSRELIDKTHDASGIGYRANPLTAAFLALLKSEYAQNLEQRARWINAAFGGKSDRDLARYMEESIGRWGAEFDRIGAIEGLEL